MKKIRIDIDDVIADSTEALRVVVNNHLGIDLQPDDYKSVDAEYWGYYEEVWRSHGVDEAFKLEDVEGQLSQDQSHIPMLAGAEFALHELAKKYKIVLITSRSSEWESATKVWLEKNMPKIDLEVFFAANKRLPLQDKSKGSICKSLGVDMLIDDNPEHCQSALDNGIETILFGEYGWSKNASSDFIRCNGWPDVLDKLM